MQRRVCSLHLDLLFSRFIPEFKNLCALNSLALYSYFFFILLFGLNLVPNHLDDSPVKLVELLALHLHGFAKLHLNDWVDCNYIVINSPRISSILPCSVFTHQNGFVSSDKSRHAVRNIL